MDESHSKYSSLFASLARTNTEQEQIEDQNSLAKLLEQLMEQNRKTNELLERLIVSDLAIIGQSTTSTSVHDQRQNDHSTEASSTSNIGSPGQMAKMLSVLESMNKKLRSMEKNSNLDHDDQPFARHELENSEPAWRAIYDTLNTAMKDKVVRWKSGMDASLIFVGLFVTIITAFLVPVLQNLAPDPADLTNTILANLTTIIYDIAVMNGLQVPSKLAQPEIFHPSLSDEIVSFFFYSALLLSLITAIFSVFGRQWVEHLTKKPIGQSYIEKSQRLNLRDELANKILKPILDSLHPILLSSISFFIVGLIYQLWSTSLTGNKSITLILTSSIGSGLVLCTSIAAGATIFHGSHYDESPFTTRTSSSNPLTRSKSFKVKLSRRSLLPLFCNSIAQMDNREDYNHVSSVRLFHTFWGVSEDRESLASSLDITRAVDSIVHFLGSDASQKAKLTMSWNLLDLSRSLLQNTDYDKLREALMSLEDDIPPYTQENIRLGFLFVRMVLFLRSNKKDVDVSAMCPFLDWKKLKMIFLEVLALPGFYMEKDCVAEGLVGLVRRDPGFVDDIREELGDVVRLNDGDLFWRSTIMSCLSTGETDV